MRDGSSSFFVAAKIVNSGAAVKRAKNVAMWTIDYVYVVLLALDDAQLCVCVLLCFIEPIVGNRGPGDSEPGDTWISLNQHLNYVAGSTRPVCHPTPKRIP